jgi:hypothetical protein
MKVSELMSKLEKLDPNLEVYCYTEDERFATPDHPFWLLDLHHVETVKASLSRDVNRLPIATFEHSATARTIVTLDATADF